MHSSLWEGRVLHGRMVADLTESVGPDALDLLSKVLLSQMTGVSDQNVLFHVLSVP